MRYFFSKKEARQRSQACKFDEHFNLKQEVHKDTTVAKELMTAPNENLCSSIKKFSNLLISLLDDETIQLNHLLAFEENIQYMDKFLGKNSGYYGTPLNENITAEIRRVLEQDVNNETVIDHLSIHNKIACIFWEVSTGFRTVSESISNEVKRIVPLISNAFSQDNQTAINFEQYVTRCNQLFPKEKEMDDVRERRLKPGNPLLAVKTAGIYPSKGYGVRKSKNTEEEHNRGADFWRIKWSIENEFVLNAKKHQLPLISGASGTTARWLSLLELCHFHQNQPEDFCNYAAAIAAYMPHCGHHSWHETAYILNRSAVNYDQTNRFASIIPTAVMRSERLEQLIEKSLHETACEEKAVSPVFGNII